MLLLLQRYTCAINRRIRLKYKIIIVYLIIGITILILCCTKENQKETTNIQTRVFDTEVRILDYTRVSKIHTDKMASSTDYRKWIREPRDNGVIDTRAVKQDTPLRKSKQDTRLGKTQIDTEGKDFSENKFSSLNNDTVPKVKMDYKEKDFNDMNILFPRNGSVPKVLDMLLKDQRSDKHAIIDGTIALYVRDLLQYVGEDGLKEILAHEISAFKYKDKSTFDGKQYPLNVDIKALLKQKNNSKSASISVVNKYFKVLLNPRHKCTIHEGNLMILFIVKTSPDHFDRREAIRKTWGNEKTFREMKIVFSMGVPASVETRQHLQREWNTSRDLLYVDYKDTYYNLTYKTLSGIHWAVNDCANTKYIISVDDDMYVATDTLLTHLKNVKISPDNHFYSGLLHKSLAPIRKHDNIDEYISKYTVSTEEYKWDVYPPFIVGGFIIMSQETASEFQFAFQYTKLFKLEDVYLGILANKLGINPTHNEFVDSGKTHIMSMEFKTLIASHYYSTPEELHMAWKCHNAHTEGTFENIAMSCGHRVIITKEHVEKINNGMKSFVSWIKKRKDKNL